MTIDPPDAGAGHDPQLNGEWDPLNFHPAEPAEPEYDPQALDGLDLDDAVGWVERLAIVPPGAATQAVELAALKHYVREIGRHPRLEAAQELGLAVQSLAGRRVALLSASPTASGAARAPSDVLAA